MTPLFPDQTPAVPASPFGTDSALIASTSRQSYAPTFNRSDLQASGLNLTIVIDGEGLVQTRTETSTIASIPESEPFLAAIGNNLISALEAFQQTTSLTQTADAIQSVLAGQIPRFETVYPVEFQQGVRWFRNRIYSLDENTPGCIVQHEEITATVVAFEQSKREHLDDQYFRLIAEGSDKASFLLDEVGHIQWINPAFTRLFGFDLTNVAKQEISSVLRLMECGTQYLTRFQDALQRRVNFSGEVYAYSRDGIGMWIALELKLIESELFETPRLVGYCSDVTPIREKNEQLKKTLAEAEEMSGKLADSQRVLDFALQGAELAFWNWDLSSGVVTFNEQWATSLGYKVEELPQHISTFQSLLHPSDKLNTERAMASCLQASGETLLDIEFRLRCKSGEYQWMNARGRVVKRSSDGAAKLLCGVQYNIQSRKNAELQIEGLVRLLEDSSNEVYIFEADSLKFISANRGARVNLSYSEEELNELTLLDTMPEMSAARFRSMVRPLCNRSKHRVEFETTMARKDGTRYPAHVFLQRTKLVNQSVYAAFVLDLTQRKILEQQLAQSQKLQSLGQVAAGIAHEINTPMHMLSENLDFLLGAWKDLKQATKLERSLEQINRKTEPLLAEEKHLKRLCQNILDAIQESQMGIKRVVNITKAMKQMAHPGRIEKVPTEINQLLKDTITVSKNRWNSSCILDLALDAELPTIEALPSELSQVMLNLMVNAVDAIEERFADQDQVPGRIGIRTWQEDQWVIFEFEDNGGGIPKSRIPHIFDPFFTSKEAGKGTGQGLTICHNIVVEKHQGTIAVESQPDQGTRFTVRLPMIAPLCIHDSSETE